MYRTRLAAAAVLTLGLLAPVAGASSVAAAPKVKACGEAAQVKDHKVNRANAKAKDAKAKGKKKGHSKPTFVHNGKVTAVDAEAATLTFVVRGGQVKALRGCTLTVIVTPTTKINLNKGAATLVELEAGDQVNVKGTTSRDATTGDVTYTATRVSAAAKPAKPAKS
ncbi:hypothetical protein [Sporichthya polymorpha]|uniref:hypothetical protein n=1 Tax=Sporichthya polymorpha TaxID=35751 RepID=UPI00036734E9|nr:hypothetical protein [Sporichthya polymorpha]